MFCFFFIYSWQSPLNSYQSQLWYYIAYFCFVFFCFNIHLQIDDFLAENKASKLLLLVSIVFDDCGKVLIKFFSELNAMKRLILNYAACLNQIRTNVKDEHKTCVFLFCMHLYMKRQEEKWMQSEQIRQISRVVCRQRKLYQIMLWEIIIRRRSRTSLSQFVYM